jgi:hypothetical protein
METSRVKQQLSQVEQVISRAAQACKDDQSAPQELKDSLQELNMQSREAKQYLDGEADEQALVQCIDEMEEISDRAKQACEGARNLGAQTKPAVMQAHQQLSQLKHQLH